VLGAAWSAGVSFGVEGMALHYYAVVNFTGTWLLCYGISRIDGYFFGGGSSPDQLRWTWTALRRHKTNSR
jgi:hypothetical protein